MAFTAMSLNGAKRTCQLHLSMSAFGEIADIGGFHKGCDSRYRGQTEKCASRAEECAQFRNRFTRVVLGKEMAALDRPAAHVFGPVAPDTERTTRFNVPLVQRACTGTSAGAPLSLIKNTRNFAGPGEILTMFSSAPEATMPLRNSKN